MDNGFKRLKGLAAVGAMGVGMFAGGSARAATTSTRFSVPISNSSTTIGNWSSIGSGSLGLWSSKDSTWISGSAFQIEDACVNPCSSSSTWMTDIYDGMFGMVVNGTIYVDADGIVDLTDTTVTTDPMTDITPGIDAHIEYYFAPDAMTLRASYILANTTGAPIDTTVLVGGNYGSDGNTTIQATSSGDRTIGASDLWIATNDNTTPGGEPIEDPVSVIGTAGASITESPGEGNGNITMQYEVTVPAGETRRILVFAAGTQTNAEAEATGKTFESPAAANAAGLLAGMTNEEMVQVANINFDPDGDGTANLTAPSGGGGGGSLGLPALLGMLGLGFLTRLRRRS